MPQVRCYQTKNMKIFAIGMLALAFLAAGSEMARASGGLPTVDGLPTAEARVSTKANVPTEARALWVVRDRMTSEAGIREFVELAKQANMNILLVQVDGRGEAYYHSRILPEAGAVSAGFDPLAVAVREGHRAGLEVHAWINALTVGSFGWRHSSPKHVVNAHPDWVMVDQTGRSLLSYARPQGEVLPAMFLEPGLPPVRDFVRDAAVEVAKNYDVDGIHLDFIRYPNRNFGYSPANRETFRQLTGTDPATIANDPARLRQALGNGRFYRLRDQWDQWRREQLTAMVRQVYRGVEAVNSHVKVSAAVYPDLQDARSQRFQDWPAWLEEGIVDFVAVMAYEAEPLVVEYQVKTAVAMADGRQVYGGLGLYKLGGDANRLSEEIAKVRGAGAAGVAIFDYATLRDNRGFLETLRAGVFAEPAAVPGMGWK